jgi:hypothetical protein
MPSRVKGAAEAPERAKMLMPVAIMVPRTIDRIVPPLGFDERVGPLPISLVAPLNQCRVMTGVPDALK